MNRRDVLKLGGATVAAAAAGAVIDLSPRPVAAQAPKRGGVFRIAGFDPLGFDPHSTFSARTMTNLSFTHSRLVKVKAGPTVRPGTSPGPSRTTRRTSSGSSAESAGTPSRRSTGAN